LLDDFRDEYGIGESALGFVIGIGFVAGFVAQVTIAPLADRGHARLLVITGTALNVVGLLVMATATSVLPLLAGRFITGVAAGMAVPAIRRIVILADPANLGHNLGRLLAADVAGFAAGPALSAILVGPLGLHAPFVAIAAATLALTPFVVRISVHESVEPPNQRFAFDLLRIRPYAGAVALGCAVWLMIGSFDALWSVALDDLDASDWLANLGITLFALPLVIFGSLGGRLAQRVGPFRVGTLGLALAAGFMMLYGVLPTAGAMFAVAMVHAVSDGLTVSSTGVAVGMVVPAERQAGAQGVLGGLQTLTAGIAAPIIGTLYEHAGRSTAYAVSASLMAVLVVTGAVLARHWFGLRGGVTSEVNESVLTGAPAVSPACPDEAVGVSADGRVAGAQLDDQRSQAVDPGAFRGRMSGIDDREPAVGRLDDPVMGDVAADEHVAPGRGGPTDP
jgi:MFS family permease